MYVCMYAWMQCGPNAMISWRPPSPFAWCWLTKKLLWSCSVRCFVLRCFVLLCFSVCCFALLCLCFALLCFASPHEMHLQVWCRSVRELRLTCGMQVWISHVYVSMCACSEAQIQRLQGACLCRSRLCRSHDVGLVCTKRFRARSYSHCCSRAILFKPHSLTSGVGFW